MSEWVLTARQGVGLACRDFGGEGPCVVLLHGLAGHAGEWCETAGWLSELCRVVALDERGHGRSERFPGDVSRSAHVGDAVFVVEQLGLAPVVLVGQSLGGVTAFLVASGRPDLVRGLVVADASPAGGGSDAEAAVVEVGEALSGWPVPFASRAEAVDYFGEPSLAAEAWADGLEERGMGWWPRFDVGVMVQTLREASARSYWDEWESIRCPTSVVRAGKGIVPIVEAREMVERLPTARLVEIAEAGHDLHLERPAEWRAAVSGFLRQLPP